MKKGKHLLTFVLFALAIPFAKSNAQIPFSKEFTPKIFDPYYSRLCKSEFVSIPVNGNVISSVQENLAALNTDLKNDAVALALQHDITSPGGRHFTFEQIYNGIPIFHSQIKVNLDKQNRIKSVFDNSWNVSGWNKTALKYSIDNLNLTSIESHFRKIHSGDKTDVRSRKVIAVLNDEPVPLAEIELWDNITNEHLLLLADNSFELFLRRDLNSYHSNVTATALVFIPDPLTTAKVEYGSPYVDDSNSDITALNNQRIAADIDVTLDNGTYLLENQYVRIAEFSAPDVPPVESASPLFEFTRVQSGFEDVNTFYHLTQYQNYVVSLGFNYLASLQLNVDAHALNGADQSMFTDHVLGPRLFFGEGGVDDAEDADVIVHENGHALSFRASPNANVGSERQAVDEGLCDYLAASYSHAIDTFRWKDVFTWDGHNEYWNGRTAATQKTYPDNLQSSIHANGEIYSTTLALIFEELGREKTDKLLLQSLYGMAASMSMKDAAMLLYDADTVLYSGNNFCVIYNALLSKGLTDSFSAQLCIILNPSIDAKAGDDQTVCAGDSITIGDASSFKSEYAYSWSPAAGLGSPLSLITNASPQQTTTYVLTASQFSGAYNLDTVTVNVLQCAIRILNTEGFKSGGDLIIELPYNSDNNSIEVFDVFGKRIYRFDNLPGPSYTFSGSLLPAGGYILRVKAETAKCEQKVVKAR